MSKKGILVVVSGFSGAGKGTLMKALMNRYDNYALSISATTRKPREGEENGREYFFIEKEQFESMIDHGELIEYAKYVDNYYGTPKEYVFDKMAEGKDVILEIEIQGALKVKKRFPETLLLFVMPPSADELRRRLVGRGTETMEVIDARLHRAVEEAAGIESYDYLLINDNIDICVEEMHQLIQAQHSRVSENSELIAEMKAELQNI
ncbi:MAG: guanylate kinase [Clostridiaceae bacterium]|nr:guanylate kinase [Clostridiaceae bacterium]